MEEVIEEVENLDVDGGISVAPVINRPMKLGSVMLKALAEPGEQTREVRNTATFLSGMDFNVKIKQLAGQSTATYTTSNTSIVSIVET